MIKKFPLNALILSCVFFSASTFADVVQIGGWSFSKEKDAMTDEVNVLAGLKSLPYDESGRTAAIAVRCFNKKPEVLIAANGYFGHPTSKVMMRLDGGKPFSTEWSVAQGGKALFSLNPIMTAKQLVGHKELLIRLQPYGKGNIDAKFNLSGVDKAIEEIRKVCSWH